MMKLHLVILLSLGLVATATAHDAGHWDGQTFSVHLNGESGGQDKDDTLSFAGGHLTSEWLHHEGFEAVQYEADSDDFEATFRKGEEKVKYKGELDDGKLHGHVKWTRRHEGGHHHWKFVGAAGGAAPEHHTEAVHEQPAPKASLYTRLGGNAAITAVVSDFVDVLVADHVQTDNPAIAHSFKQADVERLKQSLTKFVGHATGGPEEYQGKDMKVTHKDMAIGEKEWAAMAQDMLKVLAKFKVPQAEQDELMAIIGTTKGDIVTK